MGEAFESTYTSKSRGVGILISKSLPFSFISKHSDPEGRYLIVTCEIHGDKHTLINIYSPPSANMKYLRNIQKIMNSISAGIILFAADLNQVFTEQDRSNLKRKPNVPKELLEFLSLNDLTDVWRQMHPRDEDYTHYSHAQNSYSRLDYFFVSKGRVDDVIASKVQDIVISDHAAVTCTMCPPTNKVLYRIWRMNRKYLKDEEFINYIIKHINEFITISVTTSKEKPPVHIIWDAFKAYIRGIIISFSSRKRAELDKKVKQLETAISRAEHLHKKSGLSKDMEYLQGLKLEYDQLLLEKANNVRYNVNKLRYISSNKKGKQLSF